MRLLLLSLFTLLTSPLVRAALPVDIATPGHVLVPGQNDAAWQPLFAALKAHGALLAEFRESRHMPFKRFPFVLSGEIRLAPGRGMSLHYQKPGERIIIIDDHGGLVRDGQGKLIETLPDDPRAQAATRAFLDVMRFDLAALAKNFALYAARDGDDWRLACVPLKTSPLADSLDPITVTGRGDLVTGLLMKKSGDQYTEIKIGKATTHITLSPADLARYFR